MPTGATSSYLPQLIPELVDSITNWPEIDQGGVTTTEVPLSKALNPNTLRGGQ